MPLTYTVASSFVSIDPFAVITVVGRLDSRTVSNSSDINSFVLRMCIDAPESTMNSLLGHCLRLPSRSMLVRRMLLRFKEVPANSVKFCGALPRTSACPFSRPQLRVCVTVCKCRGTRASLMRLSLLNNVRGGAFHFRNSNKMFGGWRKPQSEIGYRGFCALLPFSSLDLAGFRCKGSQYPERERERTQHLNIPHHRNRRFV